MPGESHYRQIPIMRQFSKFKDLLLSKGNVIKIYYNSKVWFTVVRDVGKESHVFDNLWNELGNSLDLLIFVINVS